LKREVSSILFLEESIEQNLEKFKPSHRQAVRKAQKTGIIVDESDNYAEFYQILKNNLKIRHNVTPTHTLEELLKVKKLFPSNIKLFGAFLDGKMVAGVVNFICNKDVVLAFYISHNEQYQETRALNLLFYSIFEWAIKEGYKVFDFGIFTVNEDPNFGLARFKENFGASGMFRDTFEIIL
jgi:lipid II:glycine glycyltransferase (peptidoglycan interpeptide bridge formation enzyme)